jgi:hypothetical protein
VSPDESVRRFAQDDGFVGVLKKNIPNRLTLMRLNPCPSYRDAFSFSFSAVALEPAVCGDCAIAGAKALKGTNLYGLTKVVP